MSVSVKKSFFDLYLIFTLKFFAIRINLLLLQNEMYLTCSLGVNVNVLLNWEYECLILLSYEKYGKH